MNEERMNLPMVALRGLAVLPEMVRHFDVSREKSIKAIAASMEEEQKIFLTAQKDIETMDPGLEDVYQIGCIATIKQIVKLPKKISRVLILGEARAKIESLDTEGEYLRAEVVVIPDKDNIEAAQNEEWNRQIRFQIRSVRKQWHAA